MPITTDETGFGVEQKLKAFRTFLFRKKHYSTSRCRISLLLSHNKTLDIYAENTASEQHRMENSAETVFHKKI
jgi:hypothetical protein